MPAFNPGTIVAFDWRARCPGLVWPAKPERMRAPAMEGVTVIKHPLVQHKLTLMRDKNPSTARFRQLLREIALLLTYEVTRDLKLTETDIETPLEPMRAPILEGKKLVFAS